MANDRWEYCSVWMPNKVVYYLTHEGRREVKVKFDVAIAQLGDEGWEAFAVDGSWHFRRKK